MRPKLRCYFPSWRIVMTRRAILAIAILIAFSEAAAAGVPLFGHVSCAMVRFYVARYSAPAAEKWARSHGASDTEIETARRCLHIETASLPAKPQAPAPVTEQERGPPEPANADSGQDTLHTVADQAQRADLEQVNQAKVQEPVRPSEIENGSSAPVSIAATDLTRADAKSTPSPPRHVGATHRASMARGHASWFKRLWDHLTSRRQFRVALLHR
jgi:hypothetical protein